MATPPFHEDETTIWPTPPIDISTEVKHLSTRFFTIATSTDPDSGRLFAEELFTEDGVFTTHKTLVFREYNEIASSRGKNSPLITRRSHTLHRVYAHDMHGNDIVVLGAFEIGFVNGEVVNMDFTGRFKVCGGGEEGARFEFVQIWTDPTEMKEVMERAGRAQRGDDDGVS